MAYKRVNWADHVVERPNTYTEVENDDGSITHEASPGEIIQQGTPISATNLNNGEEALLHFSVAYDWLFCVSQAQIRALQDRVDALETAAAALTT